MFPVYFKISINYYLILNKMNLALLQDFQNILKKIIILRKKKKFISRLLFYMCKIK